MHIKQVTTDIVDKKDDNAMIDGKSFFDQPINDQRLYDNIIKVATGQRDDYTTSSLLHYVYFKNYSKMIAIDLSKTTSTRC